MSGLGNEEEIHKAEVCDAVSKKKNTALHIDKIIYNYDLQSMKAVWSRN